MKKVFVLFFLTTILLLSITKTRTKPCWNYPNFFTIKVRYDVTGNQVSSLRNADYDVTNGAILANIYFLAQSGPIYSIIDAGRTGTVKYNGLYIVKGIPIDNVSIYAEFAWDA